MNKTSIEWCDYTANPIKYRDRETGKSVWACVKVSAGCAHCYSEALAKRYGRGGPFTVGQMARVEAYLDERELNALLSVKRCPRGSKVFVGDMTDVFGPWVTDEMLARMYAVFARRPDVVIQILTKRPERMWAWATDPATPSRISTAYMALQTGIREGLPFTSNLATGRVEFPWWPLANVWLGTSVEDQQRADERIPELLACPAAVRFVSAEPLLGPVDLTAIDKTHQTDPGFDALYCDDDWEGTLGDAVLDWVIVGGESGPGARPMDVAWARSLVSQCQAAGTAVFYKQGGSAHRCPHSAKGGCFECVPKDLRVREFPR